MDEEDQATGAVVAVGTLTALLALRMLTDGSEIKVGFAVAAPLLCKGWMLMPQKESLRRSNRFLTAILSSKVNSAASYLWFCLLFGNQFTPDDVLDGYPVDRLMHDIALALMAVQTQTTEILDEFPTKAAGTEKQTNAPA